MCRLCRRSHRMRTKNLGSATTPSGRKPRKFNIAAQGRCASFQLTQFPKKPSQFGFCNLLKRKPLVINPGCRKTSPSPWQMRPRDWYVRTKLACAARCGSTSIVYRSGDPVLPERNPQSPTLNRTPPACADTVGGCAEAHPAITESCQPDALEFMMM